MTDKPTEKDTGVIEDAPGKISRGWGIKEIITTVLFSVLVIILQLGAGALSLFSLDYAMIGSTAVAFFIAGPVFVLMTIRVRKFGTSLFLSVLTALVYLLYGNCWYMIPYYIAMGLLVDLIMLKPSWRIKPNRIMIAWSVYSALYVFSSIIPLAMNIEKVMEERMLEQSYIDAYTKYYTDPKWILAIVLITALGGFLGAWLGKRITRKHFAKAGVL